MTLISGTVAGVCATVSKQPLERLKWLRQVSETDSYLGHEKNYFRLARTIFSTEGMRGIFRGTMSGIFRNVPHSALVYTFYPKVNHFLVDHIPYFQTGNLANVRMRKNKGEREEGSAKRTALLHATTGSIPSILTTFFTHPMDVILLKG